MNTLENSLFDIRRMDTLASGNSWLHRLDPRAKLITTLLFILTVVSLEKYDISKMVPFVIYPMTLILAAELPFVYLLKKILIVAPFAILVGIGNPLMDTRPLVEIGSFTISGGWVSFTSILMRFVLTVSAALILICLTGFNAVCLSLERLKVPGPFVVQLMFLYRYLFVLIEEASRMLRARALRAFDSRGMPFGVFIRLLGQLLLRTLDRSQRIHLAMCCRGFDGRIRHHLPMAFGRREIVFILAWSVFFGIAGYINLPEAIGSKVGEWFL